MNGPSALERSVALCCLLAVGARALQILPASSGGLLSGARSLWQLLPSEDPVLLQADGEVQSEMDCRIDDESLRRGIPAGSLDSWGHGRPSGPQDQDTDSFDKDFTTDADNPLEEKSFSSDATGLTPEQVKQERKRAAKTMRALADKLEPEAEAARKSYKNLQSDASNPLDHFTQEHYDAKGEAASTSTISSTHQPRGDESSEGTGDAVEDSQNQDTDDEDSEDEGANSESLDDEGSGEKDKADDSEDEEDDDTEDEKVKDDSDEDEEDDDESTVKQGSEDEREKGKDSEDEAQENESNDDEGGEEDGSEGSEENDSKEGDSQDSGIEEEEEDSNDDASKHEGNKDEGDENEGSKAEDSGDEGKQDESSEAEGNKDAKSKEESSNSEDGKGDLSKDSK